MYFKEPHLGFSRVDLNIQYADIRIVNSFIQMKNKIKNCFHLVHEYIILLLCYVHICMCMGMYVSLIYLIYYRLNESIN